MNPTDSKELGANPPNTEATAPAPAPQQPNQSQRLKQIRTYQGDVAEALKGQNESIFSIGQQERAKQDQAPVPEIEDERGPSKEAKKMILLVLGSMVLLGLGAGGSWYAYHEYARKTAAPVVEAPENRFISTAEEALVSAEMARLPLIEALSQESRSGLAAGEVKHINLPSVSTQEFLAALDTRAPGPLVRAFSPLFMYGAIGSEPSNFIIIKLASFENAYAGMLEWERHMAEDIGPIFSTSERVKNIAVSSVFKDITDRNKDARVLRDEGGEVVMLYSFFDNDMLIITDKIDTLHTLVSRLNTEKLSR